MAETTEARPSLSREKQYESHEAQSASDWQEPDDKKQKGPSEACTRSQRDRQRVNPVHAETACDPYVVEAPMTSHRLGGEGEQAERECERACEETAKTSQLAHLSTYATEAP